jgi:hypothetical protein
MRNRHAEVKDGLSCAIQEPVALTESDKHEQSTTTVLSKLPILCSSSSILSNAQKDLPHLNDPRSLSLPPNTSSVEEPQVRSRSRSPHLAQEADHLVVSGDHGSTSDTLFPEKAHLANHGAAAKQRRSASSCQPGLLTGSKPSPLQYSKCQAGAVTIEDREDDVRYSSIPQPVEPSPQLLYLGPQRLLQERQFSNRFHYFSCRCLVTGSL